MKIAVFGASGFLGTKLVTQLSKYHDVVGTYFKHKGEGLYRIDAANYEEVDKFLKEQKPVLVIDTIGLTSSLECEKNPKLAEKLNFYTAKILANSCVKNNALMVFISSNYVFDGNKGNYREEDSPNSKLNYSVTKILGENEVLKAKGIVLRVDIMYGYNGKGKPNGVFGKVLSNNIIEERNPQQLRKPIFVDDLAEIIISLANKKQKGTFHACGPDLTTMYDFLRNLEEVVRDESKMKIISDPDALVKPPMNATLSTDKLNNLGIVPNSLKYGLDEIKKQIKQDPLFQ